MNSVNTRERPVEPTGVSNVFKVMVIATKLITTMCPAEIFANKRIIKEKGFVNIPNTSIGIRIIFMITGTPGIQKICPQ